ncbi:DUF7674 family protein [Mucilaginibacter ginsenosidivorans]|uniref:DUF7674 domain-containing protein n=1 Tax=Mucilaginibacter ginsenosidivorans TaxID=398053 RepID=A0A5B8UZT3_9SPHI|nr:hypothetical protein [Mucilaginibacter ginsenosidivorans]QEC64614.1 hypothetical protein FRZ54_19245 [Mucilaginibacter ginsenosidivorans]
MKLEEISQLIFKAVPEFQSFDQEDLDDELSYLFLGDFARFTNDAILNNSFHATKCLTFINQVINQYEEDADFMEKMQIGVLEMLTDYAITQKAAVRHFTGNCLQMFTGLRTSGHFKDLRNTP